MDRARGTACARAAVLPVSEAASLALIRRAVAAASVAAAAAPGAGAAAAWQGKGSRSCPSGALVRRVLKL
jgi:hypothetical protein